MLDHFLLSSQEKAEILLGIFSPDMGRSKIMILDKKYLDLGFYKII
jgi:hypothetical protein